MQIHRLQRHNLMPCDRKSLAALTKHKLKRTRSNATTLGTQPQTLFSLPWQHPTGIAGTLGNAKNWKSVCLVTAVCSAGATVSAKLQTAEQLTEVSECVEQLKALRVETMPPTYDLEQVSAKYQHDKPS
jgi:hypothetical protein